MSVREKIRKRYEQALAALVEKLERDRTVLAAILFGSLAYDEVWKHSDIDLWIIMEDGQKQGGITLCEDDVNIHAQRISRSVFKRRIEGDLSGGWLDFTFSNSALLFTKDDSVARWYATIDHIGTRDRAFQLMRNAAFLLPSLHKAEKYFYLKEDCEYSFWWLMQVVRGLATIEVLFHNRAPAREVNPPGPAIQSAIFHARLCGFCQPAQNARSRCKRARSGQPVFGRQNARPLSAPARLSHGSGRRADPV